MEHVYIDGDRYLANLNNKEVHDLLNAKPGCSLDLFIGTGFDISFSSLQTAKLTGYTFCEHCLCEGQQSQIALYFGR